MTTDEKPQALYPCQYEGCTEGEPAGYFYDNWDARRLYCDYHTSKKMMEGSRTTKDGYKKNGRRKGNRREKQKQS